MRYPLAQLERGRASKGGSVHANWSNAAPPGCKCTELVRLWPPVAERSGKVMSPPTQIVYKLSSSLISCVLDSKDWGHSFKQREDHGASWSNRWIGNSVHSDQRLFVSVLPSLTHLIVVLSKVIKQVGQVKWGYLVLIVDEQSTQHVISLPLNFQAWGSWTVRWRCEKLPRLVWVVGAAPFHP